MLPLRPRLSLCAWVVVEWIHGFGWRWVGVGCRGLCVSMSASLQGILRVVLLFRRICPCMCVCLCMPMRPCLCLRVRVRSPSCLHVQQGCLRCTLAGNHTQDPFIERLLVCGLVWDGKGGEVVIDRPLNCLRSRCCRQRCRQRCQLACGPAS